MEAPQEPTIEAATPAPAKEAAVPKRKPGRPRKVKEETAAPQATETPKVAEPELNFEAKAPKTEPQAEAKAEKNIVPDESPILAEAADDFIPIEDLPTEKIELPSELIGKFEATKAETPATPTPTPAAAPAEPQHNIVSSCVSPGVFILCQNLAEYIINCCVCIYFISFCFDPGIQVSCMKCMIGVILITVMDTVSK